MHARRLRGCSATLEECGRDAEPYRYARGSAEDGRAWRCNLSGRDDASDRIVGSVIGGWDGWRGNIYRLAVAPEARRHGVAAALVREVSARLAREKGARRITALVEKAHPDAVGFWDSMASEGYVFDPRIVRYVKTVA